MIQLCFRIYFGQRRNDRYNKKLPKATLFKAQFYKKVFLFILLLSLTARVFVSDVLMCCLRLRSSFRCSPLGQALGLTPSIR